MRDILNSDSISNNCFPGVPGLGIWVEIGGRVCFGCLAHTYDLFTGYFWVRNPIQTGYCAGVRALFPTPSLYLPTPRLYTTVLSRQLDGWIDGK